MDFSNYGDDDFGESSDFDKVISKDFSKLVPDAGKSFFDGVLDPNADWLDTLFDDALLNDCMMSEAVQPNPTVKSEHSYSMHRNEEALDMRIKQEKMDEDFTFLSATVNPNRVMQGEVEIKEEPEDPVYVSTDMSDSCTEEIDVQDCTSMYTVGPTGNPQTLLRPTIILTSQAAGGKLQTSTAPRYQSVASDSLSLPPTPPSSHNSDSDGSHSPDRSSPSSPERNSLYCSRQRDCASGSMFMSPIPSSGVLLLSEEEKRTLVAEGYPVPQKLPLSKQEEKNLKKIRRKIKNKISAQESRRKKKEYVEGLERKVEAFSQENVDLRRKMDHLENNNRSLSTQLQKLQALVYKLKPTAAHASTGIMVVMLCFAVFLGAWSPATLLNASYGHTKSEGYSVQELCIPPMYNCWNACCDPRGDKTQDDLKSSSVSDDEHRATPPIIESSVMLPARVLLGLSYTEDSEHCYQGVQNIPWYLSAPMDLEQAEQIQPVTETNVTQPLKTPPDNTVIVAGLHLAT